MHNQPQNNQPHITGRAWILSIFCILVILISLIRPQTLNENLCANRTFLVYNHNSTLHLCFFFSDFMCRILSSQDDISYRRNLSLMRGISCFIFYSSAVFHSSSHLRKPSQVYDLLLFMILITGCTWVLNYIGNSLRGTFLVALRGHPDALSWGHAAWRHRSRRFRASVIIHLQVTRRLPSRVAAARGGAT